MSEKALIGRHKIIRQSLNNRIVHWMVALSTFVLLFTGFGQMPMYQRYGLSSLPGFAWAADYRLTLTAHYAAGTVLVYAVVYHLIYHIIRREFGILPRRGDFKESLQVIGSMCRLCKAPACEKYLGEQRLAYAFIGINLLVATVTGSIKAYKNMPGAELSQGILLAATNLHNLAAIMLVLGIFGHLAAFAFKENRALLSAMFSGCVELEYVKKRHAHWYNGLLARPEKLLKSLCAKKRLTKKHKIASIKNERNGIPA